MQQCCNNKIKEKIYNKVEKIGGRLTKIRRLIIDILANNSCLLSKKNLLNELKKIKIKPHRSTIYREIKFLVKNKIIKKFILMDNEYYEIIQDHHHHLICINCFSISRINLKNCFKDKNKIIKQNKFEITDHNFEIYGRCLKCLINKK